jgi:hypothetical protein
MRRLVIRPFPYIPLVTSSAFNPPSLTPTAHMPAQLHRHATRFPSLDKSKTFDRDRIVVSVSVE